VSRGSGQVIELARDARAAFEAEAADMPELLERARTLDACIEALREVLGGAAARIAWDRVKTRASVQDAAEALGAALASMAAALESVAERGRLLGATARRARELETRLSSLAQASSEDSVRWLEIGARELRWHASPLDVAEPFAQWVRAQSGAWVLTSATLAVGGHIEPFAERLGLDDARMRVWESPFDFARQALCYLPPDMPQPGDDGYVDAVIDAVVPVLEASGGRAFVLFTSHQALRRAAATLGTRVAFTLLTQGTAPRDALLDRFRATPGAVLLGTASFWEGVDVRGDALSCVIIDKLPFAPPDDPVNEARARALKARGRDPFMEYQLPQAVIALKQGVGRLIRDADDRGVVVLCDPRLVTRAYGRVFIKSLPPMKPTRDIEDVAEFFSRS